MFFESSSEQDRILTAWQTIPLRMFGLDSASEDTDASSPIFKEASFTRYFYDVNNSAIWGSYQGLFGYNHSFRPAIGWHGLRHEMVGQGIHQPQLPVARMRGHLKIQDPLELVTDFYDYYMQYSVQDEVRHRTIKLDKPQKVGYSLIMGTYPPRTPDICAVGPLESFEGIALRYYGDPSYAPFIAEANGLSSDSSVGAGQTINLPQMVRSHNSSHTQYPYYRFANALMNQFQLHFVTCQPPPSHHSFWKNLVHIVEEVIAVTIATLLTVGTDGAAAPLTVGMTSFMTGMVAAGIAAATDATFQVMNMALHIQNGFSLSEMAEVGISAGFTAGFAAQLKVAKATGDLFKEIRAISEMVISQQTTELTTGLAHKLDFRQMLLNIIEQAVQIKLTQAMPTGVKNIPPPVADQLLIDNVTNLALTSMIKGRLDIENFAANAIGSAAGGWIGGKLADRIQTSLLQQTRASVEAKAASTAAQKAQTNSRTQVTKPQQPNLEGVAKQKSTDRREHDEEADDKIASDKNSKTQSQSTSTAHPKQTTTAPRTVVDKKQTGSTVYSVTERKRDLLAPSPNDNPVVTYVLGAGRSARKTLFDLKSIGEQFLDGAQYHVSHPIDAFYNDVTVSAPRLLTSLANGVNSTLEYGWDVANYATQQTFGISNQAAQLRGAADVKTFQQSYTRFSHLDLASQVEAEYTFATKAIVNMVGMEAAPVIMRAATETAPVLLHTASKASALTPRTMASVATSSAVDVVAPVAKSASSNHSLSFWQRTTSAVVPKPNLAIEMPRTEMLATKGVGFFARAERVVPESTIDFDSTLHDVLKAPEVTQGSHDATSINSAAALRSKLSAIQKAQAIAVRTKVLPDGSIRYYRAEIPSRTPGITRGASYVTEHNPKTGSVKAWMESYDQVGNVNRIHPKMLNGQTLMSPHYPSIASELLQDLVDRIPTTNSIPSFSP